MKKVLLTGISGYVGLHCAVELLKQGYNVKGSLRSLSKAEHVSQVIKEHIDPQDRLEFCQLDLLKDADWNEAATDCDYLMHVASPYVMQEPKDANELIQPAVEGTLRALNAAKSARMKKVVLTSSMVAMLGNARGVVHIDQDTWTNLENKHLSAYIKSKTLAEQQAWAFVHNQEGNHKLELTVINPGPIYGPTIANQISGESMTLFRDMITGKLSLLPQSAINMSDVRDVAYIQTKALENEQSNGQRFIVASEAIHSFQDIAKILKDNGYDKVSTRLAPNFLIQFMARFNREMKGLLPFVGNTFIGNISETKKIFQWQPRALKNTVLETAKNVEDILYG